MQWRCSLYWPPSIYSRALYLARTFAPFAARAARRSCRYRERKRDNLLLLNAFPPAFSRRFQHPQFSGCGGIRACQPPIATSGWRHHTGLVRGQRRQNRTRDAANRARLYAYRVIAGTALEAGPGNFNNERRTTTPPQPTLPMRSSYQH